MARGKLVNQSSISTTTLYTPTQDGLFRLTVYATITKTGSVGSGWQYNVAWTDDSGSQNGGQGLIIAGNSDAVTGSFLWVNLNNYGATLALEAKGGTPVTYSVAQTGSADNSAYSLYYTLERLE